MNLRKRNLGVAASAGIAACAALLLAGTAGAQAAKPDTAPKTAASRESSSPSVSEVTATSVTKGAASAYLQVVGEKGPVAGRSTAPGKQGWIEVSSWSWGAANAGSSSRDANSGVASGRRMHQAIVIHKEIDETSPLLAQMCASGQHIVRLQFEGLEDGQPVRATMSDAVISSVQKSSGGDRPTESVTFTFQKIEYTR
jgi:type VI secretion system secreted protein Hcp